jgi:hypothetical protein
MLITRNPRTNPDSNFQASCLPTLHSKNTSLSKPFRRLNSSPQRPRLPEVSLRSRLPDVASSSLNHRHPSERVAAKNVNLCKCGTCQVLSSQGCQADIHKNGSKLWYVMHTIVENLQGGAMEVNDSSRIWTTLLTIVESIKCPECRTQSNLWLLSISPSSGDLPMRKEDWMFTVWKHHDEANKRVRAGGWVSDLKLPLSTTLSWAEYLQNFRVKMVTCDIGLLSSKPLPATKTEMLTLEVRLCL